MKFKVKHHLWIWALFILLNAFLIRMFQLGMYFIPCIIFILEIIAVLPEASHFKYDITYRQLTVKRIIYHDISFPCSSITSVEKAELLELNGKFKLKSSLGAYKITYIAKKRNNEYMKSVIVSAKEREKFLSELALNVNAKIQNDIKDLIKDININGHTVVKF